MSIRLSWILGAVVLFSVISCMDEHDKPPYMQFALLDGLSAPEIPTMTTPWITYSGSSAYTGTPTPSSEPCSFPTERWNVVVEHAKEPDFSSHGIACNQASAKLTSHFDSCSPTSYWEPGDGLYTPGEGAFTNCLEGSIHEGKPAFRPKVVSFKGISTGDLYSAYTVFSLLDSSEPGADPFDARIVVGENNSTDRFGEHIYCDGDDWCEAEMVGFYHVAAAGKGNYAARQIIIVWIERDSGFGYNLRGVQLRPWSEEFEILDMPDSEECLHSEGRNCQFFPSVTYDVERRQWAVTWIEAGDGFARLLAMPIDGYGTPLKELIVEVASWPSMSEVYHFQRTFHEHAHAEPTIAYNYRSGNYLVVYQSWDGTDIMTLETHVSYLEHVAAGLAPVGTCLVQWTAPSSIPTYFDLEYTNDGFGTSPPGYSMSLLIFYNTNAKMLPLYREYRVDCADEPVDVSTIDDDYYGFPWDIAFKYDGYDPYIWPKYNGVVFTYLGPPMAEWKTYTELY